jgi:hypothetical protein
MEIVESSQVQISIGSILTITSGIVVTLAGCVAFLFKFHNDRIVKKDEVIDKKNDAIIELTRSCMETTIGVKTALENNTKVIEKLPENFMLRMKAEKD